MQRSILRLKAGFYKNYPLSLQKSAPRARTMYLRPAHTETHVPTLYEFIKDNPLGVLTTAIKSDNYPMLQSSHIPWVLDLPDVSLSSSSEPQRAKLRGHMARANPHANALSEAAASPKTGEVSKAKCTKLEEEVMILFTSPVHHYVTPKFYVETKPSTGKVVPTWDYAAVQCYGLVTVFSDGSAPETVEYLTKQINDLSEQSEKIFGYDGREGRPNAWNVNESPDSYVNLLKKAIIGVEVEITRIHGKWKMSQELAKGDRQGVIDGFQKLGTEAGNDIAKIVRERGVLKDEGRKE